MTAGLTCTCVTLIGCATPYQSTGYTGGYSETQLSSNVFRVYFRGNGFTNSERAADFTLLRSAELAYEHGFPYFIITDEHSGASYSTVTTPATTYTTTNVTASGDDSAYGTSVSTTIGGQSFVIRKPSENDTIICFKGKPSVQGIVYESRFVIQSIRTKYRMKPEELVALNSTPPAPNADHPNPADASIWEDIWVPYSKTAVGELIDFDSVKVSGDVRRAWFKSTASSATMNSIPPQLTAGVDYVLALNEFNCSKKKLRILAVTFHNIDAGPSALPSGSPDSQTAKWGPVTPDSLADAAMNYLCNLNR